MRLRPLLLRRRRVGRPDTLELGGSACADGREGDPLARPCLVEGEVRDLSFEVPQAAVGGVQLFAHDLPQSGFLGFGEGAHYAALPASMGVRTRCFSLKLSSALISDGEALTSGPILTPTSR